ncbi:MAG: S41 family peptidase [Gemmatimonadales bacterium]
MRQLVATALDLVERLYVHLPLKRSMYAVNPVQRLRLLHRRLESANSTLPDRDFYDDLLNTFSELRDLHTTFILPEPFRSTTAYLPFSIEPCVTRGKREFVVSHLFTEGESGLAAAEEKGFERGVVVTHWNGVEIARAVAANASRELGSNPAARRAQGIASMTIRWLGQSLPPDEKWVDVTYRPRRARRDRRETARFEWQVFQQDRTAHRHGVAKAATRLRHTIGMDERCEVERQVRRQLLRIRSKESLKGLDPDSAIVSRMQDVFPSCRNVVTPAGTFGYIRIATFNVERDTPFLREFIRLVKRLSQKGLIIDVRGNGGGLIMAGERLLQLITPGPIDPVRFSFLNTPRTARLAANYPLFHQWKASIDQAVETGTDFSQGFPLSTAARCNDIGQQYQGPVVLITDALCYSTTDIFAAGFQDHGIGTILGVDPATGAGGANVWEYALISELAADPVALPPELPGDASFRFAVRRVTRVGTNTGLPLEDLGVRPDIEYRLTRRDVLERNVDLIDRAARILNRQPTQRLTVTRTGAVTFRIETTNIHVVDAYLGHHPVGHRLLRGNTGKYTLSLPRRAQAGRSMLRLEGFRNDRLVAATRLRLQ